jgi:hypothetical protein
MRYLLQQIADSEFKIADSEQLPAQLIQPDLSPPQSRRQPEVGPNLDHDGNSSQVCQATGTFPKLTTLPPRKLCRFNGSRLAPSLLHMMATS